LPNTTVFLAVCAFAGALAVPPSPVATPVSALIAGAAGYLGLRVWRWSRLPGATRTNGPTGFQRAVWLAGAFALGLAVGLLILAVIRLFVEPSVPAAGARIAAAGTLPIWRRLAIIFVAAVTEELVFRLILLSLIAGVLTRVPQRGGATPSLGIMWTANVLSALAFGMVHLPAWTAIGPMSAGLVIMVLALNGVAGLVMGHVFMTRGIVAAMWVHAGGDCAIQILGPLTG
jgi:hypothetical protein